MSRSQATALLALADRLSPTLKRRFLQAVQRTKDAQSLQALENALRSGSQVAVQQALGLDTMRAGLARAFQTILATYQAGGDLTAGFLRDQLGAAISFQLTNPRAVDWAAEASARFVTGITEQTRVALREVIERAFVEGLAPREAAPLIRELVGLTERQTMAVINYRFELLEAGKDADTVARAATRYSRQLLNYRSLLIARTETVAASNAGQHELWRQARDAGLLDTDRMQRRWSTAHDERTCPICLPMDGQTVGFDQLFEAGDGSRVLHPPAHPACRCSVGAVFQRRQQAA